VHFSCLFLFLRAGHVHNFSHYLLLPEADLVKGNGVD
jgi:hypothetical protein